MSEYERIVAAYDNNPKCRNYDFSVARARVDELDKWKQRAEQAEAELARWRLLFGDVPLAEPIVPLIGRLRRAESEVVGYRAMFKSFGSGSERGRP